MMQLNDVIAYLSHYDGRVLTFMEVCGTHTASIFKNGIRSIISDKIRLISGPGCPVCVTPTSYIDKCIEYALKKNHVLLTFGDMIKVPGENGSLSSAAGDGANIELMYSPSEVLKKAQLNPHITYVVAAVGFETTAPAYALVLQEAKRLGLKNIKLLTAIKTIMPALCWLCESDSTIDGFIAPGHVSVITGSKAFEPIAQSYKKPFAVAGFEAEHILTAIYDLVRQAQNESFEVHNLYKNAVKHEGNIKAQRLLSECFEKGPAMWRGLGNIANSGLYLSHEFESWDAGSRELVHDKRLADGCRCSDVIIGKITPEQCAMFCRSCTPQEPYGPCMVSAEGACGIWYRNRG